MIEKFHLLLLLFLQLLYLLFSALLLSSALSLSEVCFLPYFFLVFSLSCYHSRLSTPHLSRLLVTHFLISYHSCSFSWPISSYCPLPSLTSFLLFIIPLSLHQICTSSSLLSYLLHVFLVLPLLFPLFRLSPFPPFKILSALGGPLVL